MSIGGQYAGDLFAEIQRYAALATEIARHESFDVVHAHDWMTFPAGLQVAALKGVPLIVHVHSTEFDRSGAHVDQRIYDIERRGMHGAIKVIAVSYLTKNQCTHHYGVDESKVEVVYNGGRGTAVGSPIPVGDSPTRKRPLDRFVVPHDGVQSNGPGCARSIGCDRPGEEQKDR